MGCIHEATFIAHDVGVVVHLRGWFVRSGFDVVIFRRFQFFYCRHVRGVFKKRHLAVSKFHLLTSTANKFDLEFYKSIAKEYFHSEIISSQKMVM